MIGVKEYIIVLIHTVFIASNIVFLFYFALAGQWYFVILIIFIVLLIVISFIQERKAQIEDEVNFWINVGAVVFFLITYGSLIIGVSVGLDSFFIETWLFFAAGLCSITTGDELGKSYARMV